MLSLVCPDHETIPVQSMQNALHKANKTGDKVQGLYTWRVPALSGKLLAISLAAAAALAFVPFRFLAPFVVVDVFTSKWQRPGTFRRIIEAMPVSEEFDHPHSD